MSESGGAERLRQVVESPRARRAAAREEDGPLDPSRLHRLRDRLAHSCPYEHAADGGREGYHQGRPAGLAPTVTNTQGNHRARRTIVSRGHLKGRRRRRRRLVTL